MGMKPGTAPPPMFCCSAPFCGCGGDLTLRPGRGTRDEAWYNGPVGFATPIPPVPPCGQCPGPCCGCGCEWWWEGGFGSAVQPAINPPLTRFAIWTPHAAAPCPARFGPAAPPVNWPVWHRDMPHGVPPNGTARPMRRHSPPAFLRITLRRKACGQPQADPASRVPVRDAVAAARHPATGRRRRHLAMTADHSRGRPSLASRQADPGCKLRDGT